MQSWAPLQVLHGDTDVLFPVSGVASFSPAGGCFLTALSLHYECRVLAPRTTGVSGPHLLLGVGARRPGFRTGGLLRFVGTVGLVSLPVEPGYFDMPSPE